jgi:hypothetical protein
MMMRCHVECLLPLSQRMLDAEYEECIRATKGYDFADYDSGPKEGDLPLDAEEKAAEVAAAADPATVRAYGYAPFSGTTAVASADPDESHSAETQGEDEWSEAWATYKQECKEEEDDAAARGITAEDVRTQTHPAEAPTPPKPLTQGKRTARDNNTAVSTRLQCVQYAAAHEYDCLCKMRLLLSETCLCFGVAGVPSLSPPQLRYRRSAPSCRRSSCDRRCGHSGQCTRMHFCTWIQFASEIDFIGCCTRELGRHAIGCEARRRHGLTSITA